LSFFAFGLITLLLYEATMSISTKGWAVALFLLVALISAAFYASRSWQRGHRHVGLINSANFLKNAAIEFREHGSYTDQWRDTHVFVYTNRHAQYRCMLAAESPRYQEFGLLAITTNDIVIWIGKNQDVMPFEGNFGRLP
jgi:hypothetical protein